MPCFHFENRLKAVLENDNGGSARLNLIVGESACAGAGCGRISNPLCTLEALSYFCQHSRGSNRTIAYVLYYRRYRRLLLCPQSPVISPRAAARPLHIILVAADIKWWWLLTLLALLALRSRLYIKKQRRNALLLSMLHPQSPPTRYQLLNLKKTGNLILCSSVTPSPQAFMLHEKYETLSPYMPMEMSADASLVKIYDQPLPTDNFLSSYTIRSFTLFRWISF